MLNQCYLLLSALLRTYRAAGTYRDVGDWSPPFLSDTLTLFLSVVLGRDRLCPPHTQACPPTNFFDIPAALLTPHFQANQRSVINNALEVSSLDMHDCPKKIWCLHALIPASFQSYLINLIQLGILANSIVQLKLFTQFYDHFDNNYW